jgi:hypothetical protein
VLLDRHRRRRQLRLTRRRAGSRGVAIGILAGLALAPARISAHEPHKPPATAGAANAHLAAAIPLPPEWVESPPPAAEGALGPMLTADGDGFLATWIEPVAGRAHRVRFARWRSGSWSAATTVREGSRLFANWADVPGAVRAPDRSLYAWWLENSAGSTYAYDAQLARSTDEGATFQALGPLHEDRSAVEHGFVSAAAERGERAGVRFYFLDGRATEKGAPMQLRSVLVEGDRVGASEIVDESVCDCCSTAAAALPEGSAVAYRDRTAAEMRDIQVALRPGDGTYAARPVGKDGWKIAGCPVNGPALAGDGSRLAVAWFSAPEDRARMSVAGSADGGGSWGPPQRIEAGKPGGQLALAAVPGGFAVAWLEIVAGDSQLRLAIADPGGKVGPALSMARTSAGRSGGIPRLASAADRLALLWVEAGRLRFASTSGSALGAPPGSR